jgi:hypothetical protein
LQIPKTASSSIQKVCGERNLIHKHRGLIANKFGKQPLYRGIFDTRHLTASDIFSVFNRQVFDYFSFAVVREPVARLISSWKFGQKMKLGYLYGFANGCTFEQYVDFLYEAYQNGRRDILILRSQSEWVDSPIFKPTVIIRYEKLQQDWKSMIEEYKISGLPLELPHENVSQEGNVDISAATKKKILDIYQNDRYLYPET